LKHHSPGTFLEIVMPESHREEIRIMKKMIGYAAVAMVALAFSSNTAAAGEKGNAEEYHHAITLCYQHCADHAKALFNQVSKGALNLEIAEDFMKQIEDDLYHARAYQALALKRCSEAEVKMISEEHLVIRGGQASAATALSTMKNEIEQLNPDLNKIKLLTSVIFDGAERAAQAQLETMKKLHVPEEVSPNP
jgi:hypothetical protein